MAESVQKKLNRVRKPRVHITYDVETGGAQVTKELPFVVGVLGDFSGKPYEPLKPVRDRKFIQIDRDNFDDVMKGLEPRAAFQVKNELTEAGGSFGVNLAFRSMDDFGPDAVVQQIEPLRRLLEARSKLADLRNKLAGNDKLESLLSDVLANTQQLQALAGETGAGANGESGQSGDSAEDKQGE